MGTKTCVASAARIRLLSMDEIDSRIDSLISEVTAPLAAFEETASHEPRWICAGELVRRMRPFLVLN